VTQTATERPAQAPGEITEPGRYELTDEQYHRDPVKGGSLSSTGARTLLPPSCPARFRWQRDHGRPDTGAFDLGRAAHRDVLGAGGDTIVITGTGKDPNAWRTADDLAAVKAARAAGQTPIRPRDLVVVKAMAQALREHPVAGPLLARPGLAEQSFIARDPESGVMCRARVDWMPAVADDARVIVVDYKTTTSAQPAAFARSMADFGYHQQGPFYTDVITWLGDDHGTEPLFVLVAQEKEPPYLVTVATPTSRAIEWGRVLNRKARDVYRECVEANHWPGYSAAIEQLDLPGWLDAHQVGAYDTIGDLP
jgi:hypothetical protein